MIAADNALPIVFIYLFVAARKAAIAGGARRDAVLVGHHGHVFGGFARGIDIGHIAVGQLHAVLRVISTLHKGRAVGQVFRQGLAAGDAQAIDQRHALG